MFQCGTEGRECLVWSWEVHLAPTEWPKGIWLPDDDVGYFIRDPAFNFVINQAINVINDPGLVAEVTRFQYLSAQMPAVLERSNILKRLLQDMEKHWDEVKALNDAFSNEYQQCVAWLQAGHARCYDPPPFFSSPSTITITTPAPAPAPVPAASPACAVTPVARRAPARTPTNYVYPSLPEALIPVRAILPSHTAASPAQQLRGEPDTMDVDDKSPTPRHQGAQESRTTTP